MRKIAFVFPGQGAQYVGMGKDFYDTVPVSREVYHIASQASGLDIPGICFAENDLINETQYTQIAMLATEVAILKALEEKGIESQVNAGLSLGEYGALVASKALDMEAAFKLVRQRGLLMQQAVPTGGAMAAILGLDGDVIASICDATEGIVSIANYNCPGQIVITGQTDAVTAACEQLKLNGAKRAIMLNVSGPFHSVMLAEAGNNLGITLESISVHDIKTPYVANVTAEYINDKMQVKELLQEQVYSSVRWQQSVEKMIADGIDTFIEIGPGRSLSGFMRKINRDVTTLNVEKLQDLEELSLC